VATLEDLLHIDHLVAQLLGQGLGKLANLFSDFQFRSGQGQKTEWSRLPHS